MTDLGKKRRKKRVMTALHRVEEVLRRWDPLRLKPGEFAPADEYDSYAPHIVSLLTGGATLQELRAHLGHIRAAAMGLPPDPDRDGQCAAELASWWRSREG